MKKNNYIKIAGFLISLCLILIPLFIISAQPPSAPKATIENPLTSQDVEDILKNILNLVAKVGTIVVVFFIIWSGYKFVISRGDPGERNKAKDMFFATIIGGAILLGAGVIATVVINTVKTTVGLE